MNDKEDHSKESRLIEHIEDLVDEVERLTEENNKAKHLLRQHIDYHNEKGDGKWHFLFDNYEGEPHKMFDVCVHTLNLIGENK